MSNSADSSLYRSRFGGLWTDRADAESILEQKIAAGECPEALRETLRSFIEGGFAHLPRGVSPTAVNRFRTFFDQMWDDPPAGVTCLHPSGDVEPVSAKLKHERRLKVVGLHAVYPLQDVIFADPVKTFLEIVFERPAVAFQTMTFRFGSEQPAHIDTAYLALSEPMSLAASWVALEDVLPGSGELFYYEGSHKMPELLFGGESKFIAGHEAEEMEFVAGLEAQCAAMGLKRGTYPANAGDVLIWAADLVHGGTTATDPDRTRMSLVTHYMPLGVMPSFYDSSGLKPRKYGQGGYVLGSSNESVRRSAASVERSLSHVAGRFRQAVSSVERLLGGTEKDSPDPSRSEAEETRSKQRWRGDEPKEALTWGQVVSGDSFFEVGSLLAALPSDPVDVLEIGPGYGRLLRWLLERERIRSYAGIELSAARVEKLGEEFDLPSCRFHQLDAESFALDQQFDLFVCSSTLEHLYPDMRKALARVCAHIRPGGTLLFDLLQADDELRIDSGVFSEPSGEFVRVYPLDQLQTLVGELGLELCAWRSYVLPLGDQPLIVDRAKAAKLIENHSGWVEIGGVKIGVERLMLHCRVPE